MSSALAFPQKFLRLTSLKKTSILLSHVPKISPSFPFFSLKIPIWDLMLRTRATLCIYPAVSYGGSASTMVWWGSRSNAHWTVNYFFLFQKPAFMYSLMNTTLKICAKKNLLSVGLPYGGETADVSKGAFVHTEGWEFLFLRVDYTSAYKSSTL